MKQNPEGEILTTISGQIGWLTIANPLNRNAMNLAMYQQIPSAINELVNAKIRVVIVQGHGDEAFGAGSDISEFKTLRTSTNAQLYDDAETAAHKAIENCPTPTVAMIQGPCRGGGLAIALACDLRYASEEATFAAQPWNHSSMQSEMHTPATYSSPQRPLMPKKPTKSDLSTE